MEENKELHNRLLKVVHRFHNCKPKFRGNSDLANIEFFMLMGISALLDAKNQGCDIGYTKDIFEYKTKQGDEAIDGITLGEIMKTSEMSMSAASKKISIFEKKGYVQRKTCETDRRKVYITLTKKGEEVCKTEKEKKRQLCQQLIEKMGNEDMENLLGLANKALDIMEEINQEQ